MYTRRLCPAEGPKRTPDAVKRLADAVKHPEQCAPARQAALHRGGTQTLLRGILAPLLLLLALCSTPPCAQAALRVEAGFTDHDKSHALGLVLKAIQSAEKSIYVAAFSFTSKDISSALAKAAERGVTVKIVADREVNTNRYTAVTYLANRKIPVRLNGEYVCMHDKFMIVDEKHVQTGSFNYTKAAARKNSENVLVLWNAPDIAASYLQHWRKLWNESQDYPARH